MSRPNLLKATATPHSEGCSRAVFLTDEVGDVRECEHGKIQVVEQPYINSPGVLVWRDLHWFWDRREYRLAKQLLQEARPRPGTSTTTTPAAIDRLTAAYGDNE